MTFDPFTLSATHIATMVKGRKISVRDIADPFAERYEGIQALLNTHIYWDRASVLDQAELIQRRVEKGEDLPLAGVPVVVKDNICTEDAPTTCGSKMLANFRPPFDATVVAKLRSAGALLFGKANQDEFAMGSSNENSAFGPVKNPWDTGRVPGGSSGGSASAVAAGLSPLALGSDTGGSIRQPASFCGIVGLKPTYGTVSRFGLVAYASSLDQIGPLGRNVSDVALALDVIGGHDPRDSTSVQRPKGEYLAELSLGGGRLPHGLRVGIVSELSGEGLHPEVRKAFENAAEMFKAGGAKVSSINLPYLKHSISTYYIIATAEASANLARYDGVEFGHRSALKSSLREMYERSRSEGFGSEVKRRIMLGTYVLSSGYYDAYYGKAQVVRNQIRRDFNRAFKECDILISPTAPTTAFRIGEKSSDPLAMYLSDIGTIGVNLAGLPAISINCGFDGNGLPIGLQMMGPAFSEATILKGAFWYEQNTEWSKQRPRI